MTIKKHTNVPTVERKNNWLKPKKDSMLKKLPKVEGVTKDIKKLYMRGYRAGVIRGRKEGIIQAMEVTHTALREIYKQLGE